MGEEFFDQNMEGTVTETAEIVEAAVEQQAEAFGQPVDAFGQQAGIAAGIPEFEGAAVEVPAQDNVVQYTEVPLQAVEGNILNGGADVLRGIRSSILELDELKARTQELSAKQQQLNKEIATKQKAMDSEIASVVSKRRSEVEKTFDASLDKTRERIKAAKAQRDKFKGTKVNERVSAETADLHEQVRSVKQEIRGIYSREHIPRIFNNNYFFSLYMPGGIGDFIIILISIVIVLAIPAAIYLALPITAETLHRGLILVGLYAAVIAVALLLFTMIFKLVREKHSDALKQVKVLRDKTVLLKKNIKRMEKSIRKDRDESQYGLEKYDAELAELDNEVNEIVERKKQALAEFESTTKKDVTEEIKARYMEDLDRMHAEVEAAHDGQSAAETRIKSMSLDISSKCEAYLGKENMSVPVLDSLIAYIDKGEAKNIAEAINLQKKSMNEKV